MQELSSLFFVPARVRDAILREFAICQGAEDEYIPFEVTISGFCWEIWVYLINEKIMVDTWFSGPVDHDRKLRDFLGKRVTGVTCLI